jgi:hypothetical protein
MKLVTLCTLLLLTLGLFLLGACGQEVATVPAATETSEAATAPAEIEPVSPLPTPTTEALGEPRAEATAVAAQTLTPSPGMGIVHGILTLGGEVAPGETLYLAPMIVTGEEISVAGLDTNTAPRAETDVTGAFAFVDVPPGAYALAIISPVGPVIVPGPGGNEITVEVQAGEAADLGTIAAPSFAP